MKENKTNLDTLLTIGSAYKALHSLYNSAMNDTVYWPEIKIGEHKKVILEADSGAKVEFEADGIVRLIYADGKTELYDNHGYNWQNLADALFKLFKVSEERYNAWLGIA